MRLRLALAFVLLSGSLAAQAQQPEYRGQINPEVKIGGGAMLGMAPAPAEIIALLPAAPGKDDQVFFYKTEFEPGRSTMAVVVEGPTRAGYLYYDFDGDGKFGPEERFALPENGVIQATVPVTAGIVTSVPVRFDYPKVVGNAGAKEQKRYLTSRIGMFLMGTVDIDGQQVLVRYMFNLKSKNVDVARVAMDCNGNGKIDVMPMGTNTELRTDQGRPAVFRIGTHYVATKSVDLKSGEIVLESRPASEYTLIELIPGSQIPDFPYKDLAGRAHHLAEFRGKYVLLNFWATG